MCAQSTELVSVGVDGRQVFDASQVVVSQTGRYVLFHDNGALGPGDYSGFPGWFLRDRIAGTSERVTRNAVGDAATCGAFGTSSLTADVSADGRFVVFSSDACNIDPSATTRLSRVYLLDRQQNSVRLIGPAPNTTAFAVRMDHAGERVLMAVGNPARLHVYDLLTGLIVEVGETHTHGSFFDTAISGDGRKVAYLGRGPDLPSGVPLQLYLFDVATRQSELLSPGIGGAFADNRIAHPHLNLDGSTVVFDNWASNLVPGGIAYSPLLRRIAQRRTEPAIRDAAGQPVYGDKPSISDDGSRIAFRGNFPAFPGHIQAFVHDLPRRQTTLVSQNNVGEVATFGASVNYCELNPVPPCSPSAPEIVDFNPSISGDGRFVGFHSLGTNLIPVDANGEYPDVYLRDLGRESSGISNAVAVPMGSSLRWLLALLIIAVASFVRPSQLH